MFEFLFYCNYFILISYFFFVFFSYSQVFLFEVFLQVRRGVESKFDQFFECFLNCMLVYNLMMCDIVNE